jgi:hypothetical protein
MTAPGILEAGTCGFSCRHSFSCSSSWDIGAMSFLPALALEQIAERLLMKG